MGRFFTSDTHINHNLVAGIRGFKTSDGEPDVDAHAEVVAANWDSVITKRDTVYVLGDIAMRGRRDVFDWFDARPGRKILIAGNHDDVAGFRSKASTAQRTWLEHFDSIHDFLNLKINGRRVLLSHYPYSGEGSEGHGVGERYTQYRLKDLGMPLLHGHTHGKEIAHGHQYHVGLDAHNLQLVPESKIAVWLNGLENE